MPLQVQAAPDGLGHSPHPPPLAIRVELETAVQAGRGQRIPMLRSDFREIHDLLRYCAHGPPAELDIHGDLTAGMFTARSPAGTMYVALPGGGLHFALDRYLDSSHITAKRCLPSSTSTATLLRGCHGAR